MLVMNGLIGSEPPSGQQDSSDGSCDSERRAEQRDYHRRRRDPKGGRGGCDQEREHQQGTDDVHGHRDHQSHDEHECH